MANTIIRPKDRAEWLEHRKGGIGSSEVATILGLNPWETPYQLWRRKMGMDEAKKETFAMKAGHILEGAVADFWADATGRDVIQRSEGDWLYINNEKEYLRASPDRTFWIPGEKRNQQNKGILECKTTRMKIDGDDLPKYWFCQLQYQLGVAELTQGSLAWLSNLEFDYRDIDFMPDFYGWMVEEIDKFWLDNILGKQEPDAITVADIVTKYQKHTNGKVIEVDDEVFKAYTALKDVRREIDALEERKAEYEAALKLSFADAEAISYGGDTLATWKAAKDSTKFDHKTYQKEHADLCVSYMITTPGSRRFLLK